jgi:hypothetical protein
VTDADDLALIVEDDLRLGVDPDVRVRRGRHDGKQRRGETAGGEETSGKAVQCESPVTIR